MEKIEEPKYMKDFLTYLKVIKGKSENTIIGYRNDLSLFFKFLKINRSLVKDICFDEINISDCNKDFIRGIDLSELFLFIEYVGERRNNINSSKARKIACLKAFFNYLHKKAKIIDENIAIELDTPKIGKRMPIYLTLEESLSLLSNMDTSSKNYKRDYCILTMFLNCGLRLSELESINIEDISGDTIKVIGKGDKQRTVYLTDSCLRAIDDYLKVRTKINPYIKDEEDKKALFISNKKNRLNKRTIEDIVRKHILNAGLSSKYTPHKLRHTAATILYKYGKVDIRTLQAILGHESVATTQIYTHIDSEDIRIAINKNPLSHR